VKSGRPEFRVWVDKHPDPSWELMPLTHIATGIGAEEIIRAGQVSPTDCEVFKEPLAYFFYGRPAYRLHGDGAVKVEAACPYCFIFDAALIKKAKAIHAFDTGAFSKRLYKHILLDEMNIEDFSLERDERRPNRMIATVFSSMRRYFEGDTSKIPAPHMGAEPREFHARAYLQLLSSPGRNEPDDRICSIEVVFDKAVQLAGNLRAVIVPHTLWGEASKAPWLEKLQLEDVEIEPYIFVPNRHAQHYYALLATAVRDLYERWGIL
jgi:hypothetical protein